MQPMPKSFDAQSFFLAFLEDTTPQRKVALNEQISTHNIAFTLDKTSLGIEFWANVDTGEINVPRRCLFRLKAHAYAYYSVVAGMLAKRNGIADYGLNDRLKKASELLTWAVRTDVATELDDGSSFSLGSVPKDYESLYERSLEPRQLACGEGVFRLAVAWIIHHEIAHISLQHSAPSGPAAVKEEYDADHAAIDWLLDVADLPPADRLATYFGVAVGLGWLSALNVYLGNSDSQTHPPECQRFYEGIKYMSKGKADEAEWPWAICQSVLLLHAQNADVPVEPQHMTGSFKDIAANLVQVIEEAIA